MAFWATPQPISLFDELTKLSNNTLTSRQPAVESQYLAVQTEVVSRLKAVASTTTDRHISIRMPWLFIATRVGVKFEVAMEGKLPLIPTSDECNWYAESLVIFLKSEGLVANYNKSDEILNISWRANDEWSSAIISDELPLSLKKGKILVLFYMDGCGWSKDIQPVWNELTEHLKSVPNLTILKIERKYSRKASISGFPCIRLYNSGLDDEFCKLDYAEFSGERTLPNLLEFVKEWARYREEC